MKGKKLKKNPNCTKKGKTKERESLNRGSQKSKKDKPNPKRIMGDSIRVGSNSEEIERIQAMYAMREAEKRERILKRKQMIESETPVLVTTE
ncbi:hypothetical protein Hanom_Chr07g00605421 [Helianthus anomalus]